MKSKFNTIFENIMNEFDPAVGDSLWQKLILTDLLDHIKRNFENASIELVNNNPTEIEIQVTFNNDKSFCIIFDEDSGKIILQCLDLDFQETLDINGVLDLFDDNFYDKLHKIANALNHE